MYYLIRLTRKLIFSFSFLLIFATSYTNFTRDCDCDYLNLCIEGKCKHKPFFPPFNAEITGGLMIIIGSALSNAGGIGGGGLLIPILILIFKFQTHEAIPISKIMIFTGALTAFIMGLKNKHPYRDAIAIDYNLAGLMIPMVLFGTMIGVSLNKVFPPPIILISLTIVLIINTYKTFSKGFSTYKKETEEKLKEKASQREETEEGMSLTSKNEENKDSKITSNTSTSVSVDRDAINSQNLSNTTSEISESPAVSEIEAARARLNALLKVEYTKDAVMFPIDKLVYIFLSYVSLLAISFLKGSQSIRSIVDIHLCSWQYWLIYSSFFPISLLVTYLYSVTILQEYQKRLSLNYPFHKSDIKWTLDILIRYSIYGLIGGVMSGLLGIGGGLILGPLLLDLGIHPLVSTATSNFLVLFTSSSTSFQFILHGMMNVNYGLVCTICSTFGSYIGTIGIQRLVAKTKRASMLIFTLALVLAVSTLLIPTHTFFQILNGKKDIWKIGSPC